MPILETGLWIFMVVAASAFTFLSFRSFGGIDMAFKIIAMVFWVGLATLHGAGFEVAATQVDLTYNSTGDLIFNQSRSYTTIPGGEDAYWLGYLFMGFAAMNLFLLFKAEVFRWR